MSRDNGNLDSKMALRRSFLRQHPKEGKPRIRVFDACQVEGVMWGQLRSEFACSYVGVDVKPKRGRLRVDSALLLERPGWRYDVVDIDTYGQPWRHWSAVMRNGSGTMTVFLTIGEAAAGPRAPLSEDGLAALGLAKLKDVLPYGILHQLNDLVLDHIVARAELYGWTIERFAESPRGLKARYVGVRMTRRQ